MTLRLVSSRPGSGSPRSPRRRGGGPFGRFARLIGLMLFVLCLAALWFVYAWTPCAACAAR